MNINVELRLSDEDNAQLVRFGDMVEYGSSLLADTLIAKDKLTPKQRFLVLEFTAVNNYAEGIFTLCNAFRPESAIVVLRSLVEAYINTAYQLSHNSDNRLTLMYIEDGFNSKGLIEEVANFYNKYPKLRPVGDPFKQKNLDLIKEILQNHIRGYEKTIGEKLTTHRDFKAKHGEVADLLRRARIADQRFKKGNFEYNYVMVYRYFSEYAHLNLKGMSHFFKETENGFEGISSQSPNINHIVVTAYFMYLFFLEKLKYYKLLPGLKISKYQKDMKFIFENFQVV